jgi:hypothetical protein
MRANAPITATLALALLSLFAAPLHARPAPLAHKTAPRAHKSQPSHHSPQAPRAHRVHAVDRPAIQKHSRIESSRRQPTLSRARATAPEPISRRGRRSRRNIRATAQPAAAQISVISAIRPIANPPQLEPVEVAAASPTILPALYNKRGRLIMPPALKGSREILLRQNQVADRDGLYRIQNDDDLDTMRQQGVLVALPASGALQIDDRLPFNRRYARPWTADFLANISRAHYSRFHTPLQVNSAVRTVEFQQHLLHINGNAAPADGDTASPHLTGQAIDLAKRGLSLTEIAWMRGYLLPLVQQGKVDVEEEFQQSCFHISVYRRYLPYPAPPREITTTSHSGTQALASALR